MFRTILAFCLDVTGVQQTLEYTVFDCRLSNTR